MPRFFLAFFLTAVTVSCQTSPRYVDARFQTADDRRPIAVPAENAPSEDWDRAYNELFRFVYNLGDIPFVVRRSAESIGLKKPREAADVNAWDEVPDSSWFTNRLGKQNWSPRRAAQGPRAAPGPDTTHPWTVIKGKEDGTTLGFTILDANHDIYFIKFDPPGFHEMASGAETVSSLIFYSLGYNVPSYYPLTVRRSIFRLGKDARTTDKYGKSRPMTETDLAKILALAATDEHGMIRVSASKILPGKVIGPFSFEGRRNDDPNDKIDHENRRELRAFYVFSSLLNNTDVRRQNTLDMYIGEAGRGHLRHYFLDFGTAMGSAGYRPKDIKEGYEFFLDYPEIGASFLQLGIREPYWLETRKSVYNAVGLFEARLFDPRRWFPTYPGAGFYLITPRDAFWAAKLLTKLSDEHLKAIVAEGRYGDPQAAAYLVKTLSLRRDKIVRLWFRRMTPLDEFHLSSDGASLSLSFTDLAVQARVFPGWRPAYSAQTDFTPRSFSAERTDGDGRVHFKFPLSSATRFRIVLAVNAANPDSGTREELGNGVRLTGFCYTADDCRIIAVERKNP